ncbi:hypothetical protein [Streptomyces sp. Amel2xC10]|uniref:hypothetical protein n=1 Tax=Streptomyces sp. Amel2xC10 TaxID=1305826 RepID=UPI000A085DAD|nr:hypothetical protein [Streptomyces sp. Amel2xC10]SMF49677.1 hypothetical protein SAMN02745830_03889 [Streptomyces sp. Amel2xC10]
MASAPSARNADVDPRVAVESLRAALDRAGIVLPSLGADSASPPLRLIELGRVRADVALRLAHALERRETAP